MKILFTSSCALDRTLGAAQTVMDLAEELETLGWHCDLAGPAQLGTQEEDYSEKLHAYLLKHAPRYDVVDFDYNRAALDCRRFDKRTLFVARCQLLVHHRETLQQPSPPTLRSRLGALLLGPRRRREMKAWMEQATATLQTADLVVVLNEPGREILTQHGVDASTIYVMPNGMSEARHHAFGALPAAPPGGAVVACIGLFGPRKGSVDFPDLVRRVVEAVPEARFRLLGTRRSPEYVLERFPRPLHRHVEVLPKYDPETLPDLLAPCSVGVFPSYREGFPLGVLEMLAAALPVVAYDAPGPPEMVLPEHLVAPGDTEAMSRKVVHLLQDPEALTAARRWARHRAQQFRWPPIAHALAERYEHALALKRSRSQEATSPA